MEFEKRLQALNTQQREAVDTIDGPVMVVAGPGTGKTELLSVRVANILKKTDTLPQNILCLTFTESGAYAMRERLAGLIGLEAYKVAVHTFHSFGSEVINQHSEYFYNGASFRPADELSAYEVLYSLFEKLPHDNPLASTMNGEYVTLRQTQSSLSHLKKSGLTPDELNDILSRNQAFLDWVQPKLQDVFAGTMSKKVLPAVQALLSETEHYDEEAMSLITYEPLYKVFNSSLELAYEQAITNNSTKPLTAWKRNWCEKRSDGTITLKDEKRTKRMQAVSGVYYDYLVAMQERGLYDFDDMILRSVHALEVFSDLRLNLQEQYQYVLVDEFQDTNDAQMRIVWNLTNNPSSEGRPNIMVVGDDDQAIYRFQGANLSNILGFSRLYRDVTRITLTNNYRSAEPILQLARRTIVQAEERLEHSHDDINKTLVANHTPQHTNVQLTYYHNQASEFSKLAHELDAALKKQPSATIAVIGRTHRQLRELLPFLYAKNIPLRYEQQENILELKPIQAVELLARTIHHIAQQELLDAEALLPELLSHPMWGIPSAELWRLSVHARQAKAGWLITLLEDSETSHTSQIAQWLVRMAYYSFHEPLEHILDLLSGVTNDEQFASPLKTYFFNPDELDSDAMTYMQYLSALTTLRGRLREYRPHARLTLSDFIEFISQHRTLGIAIEQHQTITQQGVELLTAHKAKGLEYDTVYVIGLNDHVWGESTRSGRSVSYPHNLAIGVGGDHSDERIRLLFVALTRAKNHLLLSGHRTSSSGKSLLPVAYLSSEHSRDDLTLADSVKVAETLWHDRLVPHNDTSLHELLADTLARYKLSPTHVGSYLDVSRGGPTQFLFQNLLRFPQAMNPSAAFGSAIHDTMRSAHGALTAKGKKRPVEDLLGDFELSLAKHQLAAEHHERFSKRGSDVLTRYFAQRYDTFSPEQLSERDFSSDHIVLDEVRITGVIDMLEVNHTDKTVIVTDYKTGTPVSSWKGKTDYEKVKLHHYRQQLMFYKLLVEHSRQLAGYTVTKGYIDFVEADERGNLHRLELDYNAEDIAEFRLLLHAVWKRVQTLDFSLPDEYPASYAGVLEFEKDIVARES